MKRYYKDIAAAFVVFVLFTAGCSTDYHRKKADREAYNIIEEKSRTVPGMAEEYSVEHPDTDPLQDLPQAPESVLFHESGGEVPGETLLLSLEDSLQIAAFNSREYKRRKETVFMNALSLSTERNRFSPQFSWGLKGETGYDSDDNWTAEAGSRPGMNWLLATGARLSADLSTTATRFLSGDTRSAARSVFDLTLTQPLLRDSRIAALEPLTQAERDMIYELRDFMRFQRRFSVGLLEDYYRVLERRQRVDNERVNHENLVRIRERSEALGRAGRIPEMQVDRARQNELSARDNLDQAMQTYRRALDDFKMRLGVPPESPIVLDPGELDLLHELDLPGPPVGREESIDIALENRLDLATIYQREQDAERKVLVAANALKPGLDLVLGTSARTESNQPTNFAGGTQASFARLDAELPFERTHERNTYRRRLLEYDQACRSHTEKRDEVVLEMTNRWREFEQAVSSYEIQERSVKLAQQRVESTEMLFEAGRATTRDVLDAHEDLLRAQNRLAGTLVDLRVSTLKMERDMDILVIDENGQILEGEGYNG